mgnify:CR=1 FL=1
MEALEGVIAPLTGLIAGLRPLHIPPAGLAVMVKGAAFVQNGGGCVIVGTIVLVTETTSVLCDGQTVPIGVLVVVYIKLYVFVCKPAGLNDVPATPGPLQVPTVNCTIFNRFTGAFVTHLGVMVAVIVEG